MEYKFRPNSLEILDDKMFKTMLGIWMKGNPGDDKAKTKPTIFERQYT